MTWRVPLVPGVTIAEPAAVTDKVQRFDLFVNAGDLYRQAEENALAQARRFWRARMEAEHRSVQVCPALPSATTLPCAVKMDRPSTDVLRTGPRTTLAATRRILTDDVRPLLGACDAVALCSQSVETFSLAALEAMALARPVVHSDIGGAAEMIRPGHEGYLFPAGDTPMLVEKLAALADGGERARMGAIARETVRARFAERHMIDRYESLLQETALTRSQRDSLRNSATAH